MKTVSGIKLDITKLENRIVLIAEVDKKIFEFQGYTIAEVLAECTPVFSASTLIEIEKALVYVLNP
jgi:hypothetical protein